MPLSRRAIQFSPLIFTLTAFSTPCQCWKGSGIQEGSLSASSYALGGLLLKGFGCGHFHLRGLGCLLWCHLLLAVLLHIHSQCSYQWAVANGVLQTATVITVLFIHLGILHGSHKMHHELLSNSVNTVRILALYFFVPLGTLLF